MQKVLLIVWCIVGSIQSASLDDLDRKYGFRDLFFETRVENISGLTLVADSGDQKLYRRAPDSLRLGAVPLSSIEYVFYKGEFIAAHMVCIKGPAKEKPILDVLRHAYGEPSSTSKSGSEWFGKRVLLFVIHPPSRDTVIIHIRSRPMDNRIEKELAARSIRESGL